jgi:hypothetical protein
MGGVKSKEQRELRAQLIASAMTNTNPVPSGFLRTVGISGAFGGPASRRRSAWGAGKKSSPILGQLGDT